MDKAYCGTGFEVTLRLCHEAVKTFRGSEETLKCIQRIEECLRKLIDESNQSHNIKNQCELTEAGFKYSTTIEDT